MYPFCNYACERVGSHNTMRYFISVQWQNVFYWLALQGKKPHPSPPLESLRSRARAMTGAWPLTMWCRLAYVLVDTAPCWVDTGSGCCHSPLYSSSCISLGSSLVREPLVKRVVPSEWRERLGTNPDAQDRSVYWYTPMLPRYCFLQASKINWYQQSTFQYSSKKHTFC